MSVSLRPYGSDSPNSGYIGWTPVPLVVASSADGASGTLRLSSRSATGSVAKVEFRAEREQLPEPEIEVDLQAGEEKTIFIAGAFQRDQRHNGASEEGKDVKIEARWTHDDTGADPASVDIMIRVRRDADKLSDTAREDFLFALAKLNGIKVDDDPAKGAGFGIYVTDFVDMHVLGARFSEHGDSHFLPWHRLYLLDLERQLQAIRPEVTLPYWRFDQAAPNLFTEDFMGAMDVIPRDSREPGGEPDPGGLRAPPARFAADNHLSRWQIRDVKGIPRTARFDPGSEAANGLIFVHPDFGVIDFQLRSEGGTLGLGGGVPPADPKEATFGMPSSPEGTGFAAMEGSPHGAAHVSFNGRINDVPVAPQDPLFFLLHCNVDRLWAKWQYAYDRHDPNNVRTYPYQSSDDTEQAWEIIDAEQWPWNGGTSQPGGLEPPGTRKNNFTGSDIGLNFPGKSPILKDAIDPDAHLNPNGYMGFAYDDVPYFEPPSAGV